MQLSRRLVDMEPYDIFLSHANADKLDFVEDLKKSFDKLGIKVFYDKDSIEWGDKWKDRILDGLKNSESQDYILSNKYYKDIETVQYYLGVDQNVKVGLVDFEEIVVKDHIKDGLNISEEEKKETKERLRKSYNKIEYFCERMEYLGILSEDKTVRWLIIKYYKPTIIKSYERLRNLIVKTREGRNMNDLYEHFSRLYNLAKGENLKYK